MEQCDVDLCYNVYTCRKCALSNNLDEPGPQTRRRTSTTGTVPPSVYYDIRDFLSKRAQIYLCVVLCHPEINPFPVISCTQGLQRDKWPCIITVYLAFVVLCPLLWRNQHDQEIIFFVDRALLSMSFDATCRYCITIYMQWVETENLGIFRLYDNFCPYIIK